MRAYSRALHPIQVIALLYIFVVKLSALLSVPAGTTAFPAAGAASAPAKHPPSLRLVPGRSSFPGAPPATMVPARKVQLLPATDSLVASTIVPASPVQCQNGSVTLASSAARREITTVANGIPLHLGCSLCALETSLSSSTEASLCSRRLASLRDAAPIAAATPPEPAGSGITDFPSSSFSSTDDALFLSPVSKDTELSSASPVSFAPVSRTSLPGSAETLLSSAAGAPSLSFSSFQKSVAAASLPAASHSELLSAAARRHPELLAWTPADATTVDTLPSANISTVAEVSPKEVNIAHEYDAPIPVADSSIPASPAAHAVNLTAVSLSSKSASSPVDGEASASQVTQNYSSFAADSVLSLAEGSGPRGFAAANAIVATVQDPHDHAVATYSAPDTLGAERAAGAVPSVSGVLGDDVVDQQQQQMQAIQETPQGRDIFACCSGTWVPDPRLILTPAVNIGGPVMTEKNTGKEETFLFDEDTAFMEYFARAKEELLATLVRKRRGHFNRHQNKSPSPTQHYTKRLVVTSLGRGAAAPVPGVPASPAAAINASPDGGPHVKVSGATDMPAATAIKPATRETAAAATGLTRAPLGLTAAASVEDPGTIVGEKLSLRHGSQAGQRAHEGLAGRSASNTDSLGTGDSLMGGSVPLKLQQGYRSAVTGTQSSATQRSSNGSQSHATIAATHVQERTAVETRSNNAKSKAHNSRTEAGTSRRFRDRHKEIYPEHVVPTIPRQGQQRHRQEQTSSQKDTPDVEATRAKKTGMDFRNSEATALASGPLRRRSFSPEAAVVELSKERKDRRVSLLSGHAQLPDVRATASYPEVVTASPARASANAGAVAAVHSPMNEEVALRRLTPTTLPASTGPAKAPAEALLARTVALPSSGPPFATTPPGTAGKTSGAPRIPLPDSSLPSTAAGNNLPASAAVPVRAAIPQSFLAERVGLWPAATVELPAAIAHRSSNGRDANKGSLAPQLSTAATAPSGSIGGPTGAAAAA